MKKPQLLMALYVPLAFGSCSNQVPSREPPVVAVSLVEVLTAVANDSSTLRWPQFLLPFGEGFLWAERHDFLQVEEVDERLIAKGPALVEMTLGLDRLIAGTRGPVGEIALLDSSGRVAIRESGGRLTGFTSSFGRRAASIAVADGSVSLLLQGESEGGPAIVGFSFEGNEQGRWGQMPADGLLQGILRGGGLTSCSDGSVYYSYINSARISRIMEDDHVQPIGDPPSAFVEIEPRDIRRAFHDGERERSTKPLVGLGLGASRVMALLCSPENLLFRQVTGPGEGSMRIEVWDPASAELVGVLPFEEGVLLAIEEGMLYMGVLDENEFEIRKYLYSVTGPRPLE